MESDKCPVCQCDLTPQNQIRLSCNHSSCSQCLIQFIETLKKYKKFHPDKLICLTDGCSCQIDDATISKLFKSEQGFVMNIIRKRYKQSKDPNIVIFHCQGFMDANRKPLIQKSATMSRQQHAKLINPIVRSILVGQQPIGDKKMCTYIHSFNSTKIGKETCHQCYLCGATYCVKCLQITHQGKCPEKAEKQIKFMNKFQNKSNDNDDFENFLKGNDMIRCLNQKCGLPIAKQQGCYWVKCRCSWQFCYPCQKLWGDCQHFSKYPYKKFVPPPQWMVKALKLY